MGGYWRGWDEIECEGCGALMYKKYSKKLGGKNYCPSCYEKMGGKGSTKFSERGKKNPGWHEPAKITPTHKGLRNIAPEHYIASQKFPYQSTLTQPIERENMIKNEGKKYYHTTAITGLDLHKLKPEGYYEDTSHGCPTEIFEGAGFKLSNIPESSFSKSPEACIMAMKDSDKDSKIDIYVTTEIPDVDISDCGYDFSVLEEVRYRRNVGVKFHRSVIITKGFIEQIQKCYSGDSPPDDIGLGCLKNHVRRELKKGNVVSPMLEDALVKCYAKKLGMTVEEMKAYEWIPKGINI